MINILFNVVSCIKFDVVCKFVANLNTIYIVRAYACVHRDKRALVFIKRIFAVRVFDKGHCSLLAADNHCIAACKASLVACVFFARDIAFVILRVQKLTIGAVLIDIVAVCIACKRIVQLARSRRCNFVISAIKHLVEYIEQVLNIFVKADEVESVVLRNKAYYCFTAFNVDFKVETKLDVNFVCLVFVNFFCIDVFFVCQGKQEPQ